MTTRVYLVRHGATVLSAEDAFAGETDVVLSEEGRGQARSPERRRDRCRYPQEPAHSGFKHGPGGRVAAG